MGYFKALSSHIPLKHFFVSLEKYMYPVHS